MIWLEVILFTAFALLLGAVAWWIWAQRQHAERQRIMNAELAKLGREIRSISHDVGNLLAVVLPNVEAARRVPPEELPEVLEDVERATLAAHRMFEAVRGRRPARPCEPASSEGLVRLSVALLRSSKVPIVLDVTGDLTFEGDETDVLRLVQNLIFNAAREASRVPDGTVRVELAENLLAVANPTRDGRPIEDRIYEEGESAAGSTGLGLAIAREACLRLGWSLRHEVVDGQVRFVVEPRAAA